ncbi:MAG: hypothetical protein ING75_17305 [Rhodocyclaceae bacterium]|nr:hypothetical protein [Rhodocyclaceae bacterium]
MTLTTVGRIGHDRQYIVRYLAEVDARGRESQPALRNNPFLSAAFSEGQEKTPVARRLSAPAPHFVGCW